ncbi:protein disulfide bond isomerase, DsbC/DsbG-like, one heme-binding site [Citrifermentans bemidjiense Bem]|uniref:Protein disulfide bond isomerase, DsbC/DsbG-like, one heme-binding site n=1 Tax=Citrifermentans bemidjiense (strain ATCC BAA-1014 / DSM 16622 / JCM 12645 / Bem) TaxID=404380 RepID=B5E8G8_CITBB|nr:DsbC family protein [Citrifermentans bemidjiense]ACH38553.1 protein disulfide bond isomerase, DsbC/DsbG-like, one heme-binding site [Citrifermentans bemidjiense Bem]
MSWFKGLKYLVAAASALAPLALVVPVFAMSGGCGGECASCHSITLQEAGSLLKGIGVVKDVKPAEVRGLYEVTFEQQGNSGVAYVDYSKKYIIAGQAFDIASRQPVGANAPAAKQQERLDPKTLSSNDALVMGNPKGKKKLFVFTDPECPYCAKAHGELKKLAALEPDLAIYIKLFPLKMHPNAYDKSRVILAAKSLELLENSFAGKALPAATEATPKKPVDETIRFAAAAGINSTPTLVLPDGRVLPGFKDAATMQKLLTGTN